MDFLKIDTTNDKTIANSFDVIAGELLRNYILVIEKEEFLLTEIEFYYFHDNIHEDKSTHQHEIEVRNWRQHSQGLDISLDNGVGWDGGILIRGLMNIRNQKYINGPRRIVSLIFDGFGLVDKISHDFGLKKSMSAYEGQIYKTKRHGLGNSVSDDFKKKYYRYFHSLESWNNKQVNLTEKAKIMKDYTLLNKK